MSDETAVLLTLVVYKVALVATGIATRSRTRDAAEFFLGGDEDWDRSWRQ